MVFIFSKFFLSLLLICSFGWAHEPTLEAVLVDDCLLALDHLAAEVQKVVELEHQIARKTPVKLGEMLAGSQIDGLQPTYPFAFIVRSGEVFMGRFKGRSKDLSIVVESDRTGKTFTIPAQNLAQVVAIPYRRPTGANLAVNARIDSENHIFLKQNDVVLLYVMDDSSPMYYRFMNHDNSGNLVFQKVSESGSEPTENRTLPPSVFDMDGFGILVERSSRAAR